MRNYWTFKEIEYLKTNYDKMSCDELSSKLKRSTSSIFQKAYKLGLQGRPNGSWNKGQILALDKKQIQFLKDHYEKFGAKYCANKLNKKVSTVSKIALNLNLKVDRCKSRRLNKKLIKHLKTHAKTVLQKYNEYNKINLDEKLVKKLYLEGYSSTEIAKKLNCSTGPILKALKNVSKRNSWDYDQHISKTQGNGENHHSWKGGYKSVYDRIRDLKVYWDWRNFIIKRDNGQCQVCGTKDNLEVHHKTTLKTLVTKYSKSNNKKVTDLTFEDLKDKFFYNTDNGITYCKKCHKDYHKKHGR